jgi:hypothetical protein
MRDAEQKRDYPSAQDDALNAASDIQFYAGSI